MKKLLLFTTLMLFVALSTKAQTKKDGSPDMRYKENKQTYTTPSNSTPKTNNRTYNKGGQYKIQKGYQKKSGNYVAPHLKTSPDNTKWNNKPKN